MKPAAHHIAFSQVRQSGFTLVELLVAAGITLLIAGVSVSLITSALTSWNRSHGAVVTEDQARLVVDRLEQDLHGAIYRDDGQVWLAATIQTASSISGTWVPGAKPGSPSIDPSAAKFADARFGIAGVWLRFFVTAQGTGLDGTEPAAPFAVSYQIIRRSPTPSEPSPHYLLYRAEMTAAATFAAGYDLNSASYTAGVLATPAVNQVMADNVVDFGVRLYGYTPDDGTAPPVLSLEFPLTSADLEYRARATGTADGIHHAMPAVADVLLRVLTPEGARLIAALEAGRIGGDWWAIAQAHSRVFTWRIQLKAMAL